MFAIGTFKFSFFVWEKSFCSQWFGFIILNPLEAENQYEEIFKGKKLKVKRKRNKFSNMYNTRKNKPNDDPK